MMVFRLIFPLFALGISISASAAVCKTEHGFKAHIDGCIFGGYLWSAPLERDVSKAEAEEYCKSLPKSDDTNGSWQLSPINILRELIASRAHLSFESSLDNMFWSSSTARGPSLLINGITGNVLEAYEGVSAAAICTAKFRTNIVAPENGPKASVLVNTLPMGNLFKKNHYRPGVLSDGTVVVRGGIAGGWAYPVDDENMIYKFLVEGKSSRAALYWIKDGQEKAVYKSETRFNHSPSILANNDVVVAGYQKVYTADSYRYDHRIVWLRDGKEIHSLESAEKYTRAGLVLADDTVVFSNGEDRLWGVRDGQEIFTVTLEISRRTIGHPGPAFFDLMVLSDNTIVAVHADGGICWVSMGDGSRIIQRCIDSHDQVVKQPSVTRNDTVVIQTADKIKRFRDGTLLSSHDLSSQEDVVAAPPDTPSEDPIVWFSSDNKLHWLDDKLEESTYTIDKGLRPTVAPIVYPNGTVLVFTDNNDNRHGPTLLLLKDGALKLRYEIPLKQGGYIAPNFDPVLLPNGDLVVMIARSSDWGSVFGNGTSRLEYFADMLWVTLGQ